VICRIDGPCGLGLPQMSGRSTARLRPQRLHRDGSSLWALVRTSSEIAMQLVLESLVEESFEERAPID
jgi:hypothetical protein